MYFQPSEDDDDDEGNPEPQEESPWSKAVEGFKPQSRTDETLESGGIEELVDILIQEMEARNKDIKTLQEMAMIRLRKNEKLAGVGAFP